MIGFGRDSEPMLSHGFIDLKYHKKNDVELNEFG